MGKGTGDRKAKVAKAGKRSGGYQEPPAQNPAKKAASEKGLQQFLSEKQFTQPAVRTVYDKKKNQFVDQVYEATVPFIFDEKRKQFVYSPVQEKERDTKAQKRKPRRRNG